MPESDQKRVPIAVVGVSALFPGSVDKNGFWRDILAGSDLVTDVPATHWLIEDYYDADASVPDHTYAKRGAFLPDVDFDPLAFGVPPSIVPATDTCQLLSLIVAQQVLEDASRGQFDTMNRDRISVILGVTSGQELMGSMVSRLQHPIWVKALREAGLPESQVKDACARISAHYTPWQESTFPGLLGNVVAGRIANRLNLGGTNCITDAACASAFAAVAMAVNELHLGQSDLVITGGVDTMNDIFMYMCFSKTPALSPTGDCRPFSDKADGTLLGEGIGMVALKRLDDAERDGDKIYAVLQGLGSSSDGRSKSVYAPLPEGQAKALNRAYASAGFSSSTVELLEAHGTGTKAGDAAEFQGLQMAFDASGREDRQWCALGSVKSQIGHTKSAAGAAGLFKAVMALQHRILPPTIKVERPNPKLSLEKSPFYLNTEARPWVRSSDHPRRAGVSSFGFGGSNFHLVLEEYRGEHRALRANMLPAELVVLSAASGAALAERCRSIGPVGSLAYFAWKSQQDFDGSQPARLALLARDEAELASKLATAASRIGAEPDQAFSLPNEVHYGVGAAAGKVAWLYPGQGSQYVGMGAGLAMHFEEALDAWDAAADTDNGALSRVVFPMPAFDDEGRAAQSAALTDTRRAQPAIGTASLALTRVLQKLGLSPDLTAGHSFGEVMALHVAGSFDADTALRIARRRGELMAEAASTPGGMSAVVGSAEQVRPLLDGLGDAVVIANINGPNQVVISGELDALAEAERRAAAAGLSARRLSVATGFHSRCVSASVEPFQAFLAEQSIGAPSLPVYANSSAAPYAADAVLPTLAGQIAAPVRFVEQIRAMYAEGVRVFIEVGPSAVLTGLVERILEGQPFVAVALDRKGSDGARSLLAGLARMVAAGLSPKLAALQAAYEAPSNPADRKKPALSLKINGSNYAKPYPPPGGAAALPPPNPEPEPLQPEVIVREVVKEVVREVPVGAVAQTIAQPASGQEAWLHAFQDVQARTAEAHTAYQQAMAQSHIAFLRTVESSFAGLTALVTGQAPRVLTVQPQQQIEALPNPASYAAPQHAIVEVQAPTLSPAPVAVQHADIALTAVSPSAPFAAPPVAAPKVAAPKAAAPKAAAPQAGVDIHQLLLDVVSEKTGYPAEMLSPEMGLESDLGIDSIKRVEILSALRERAPSLPELEAGQMASLRTLGQIVEAMGAAAPAPKAAVAAPVAAVAAPVAAPVAAQSGPDIHQLLLDVVAEKTGYPAEMLTPEMGLEADLGIDSIKRVEILSAMRERAPSLPELEAGQMANLRTLGQIAEAMGTRGEVLHPSVPAVETPRPSRSGLSRYVLRSELAPAAGFAISGLSSARRVVVTDDGRGVADALVALLNSRGFTAIKAEPDADCDALIELCGLAEVSDEQALALQRLAFQRARAVAERVGAGGTYVCVQDSGGEFGAARPWLSGLSALARTAAQEWPKAGVRAIDLERGTRAPEALAGAIFDELFQGGVEREVGLKADGRRLTLRSVAEAVTPGEATVNASSVVVVSGGARGVTAACLVELARNSRCRFALLGRTALEAEPEACRGIEDEAGLKRALLMAAKAAGQAVSPAELGARVGRVLNNREVNGTLSALKAAGSDARYLALDVQNPQAVREALDGVRRELGPISGLVHAAGVLADRKIAEKTDAQFDRVFDTKVQGLRVLLDATAQDSLSVLAFFSSVAARTGNQGQCDYAMANETLNKVARAEAARRPGCQVRSFGWGPWEGGMVTPALKARFQEMGVALIPLAVGAEMFVEELSDTSGDVELVLGGEPRPEPLLSSGESSADVVYPIHLAAWNHPYLADHAIRGVPVVPVVMVLEWFARAARLFAPHLSLRACRDVRVLRGVRLENFAGRGDALSICVRQIRNGDGAVLQLELRGANNTLHYSAVVELGVAPSAPGGRESAMSLEPFGLPVYGDVLFHGPEFQVIRSMQGLSRDGASAELSDTRSLSWSEEDSCIDPASMDGGLQVALLWTRHVLGGPSLPTALGAWRGYGDSGGPLRAELRARSVTASRAVSDIRFFAGDGRVVADLEGVETHLLPPATS